MNWVGSVPNSPIEKNGLVDGYYTYAEKGSENIRASGFKSLTYKGLYKGVDLNYKVPGGDSLGVKYDLVIHPNGDYQSIKMHYQGDLSSIQLNAGNLEIMTPAGLVIDHAPVAYYQESGKAVAVKFVQENDVVSFEFPNGIDALQTVIIDPWMVTPTALTNNTHAYDVDFDDQGNVYVAGGDFQFKLSKYDPNGNFLWTFNNTIFPEPYYAEFGLIRATQSVYIPEGFGLPMVLKVDALGMLEFNQTVNTPNNEIWTIFHNSCTGKMLGFGGGTTGIENLYLFSDTLLTSVSMLNCNGSTGSCCNDITDAIIDFNGDIYILSVSSSGATGVHNRIYKNLQSNNYIAPSAFSIATGYNFSECGCTQSSHFNNVGAANVMALNSNFLFSYNGNKIDAWDKTTGAPVASVVVNAAYLSGDDRNHQGIAVDECNNIYVAGNQAVHTYNFDGVTFTPTGDLTTNIPDEVFDVSLNEGSAILYVSGKGFLSAIPATPCNLMTVSADINCLISSVTISPDGGTPPYTYLWSNGSTSSTVVLEPGTHTVTIQDASCIKRTSIQTVEIGPSAVANLDVVIPNVFSPTTMIKTHCS